MTTSKKFEDGLVRCSWLNSDLLYRQYHDTEWGVRVAGDQQIFERIALEGFQAGLSWITILKRRESFRKAFKNFDLRKVARMTEADIEKLMLNEGIIRNRAKIQATIQNANIILELQKNGQSISDIVWSFAPPPSRRKRAAANFTWLAATAESEALSNHLRKLGFSFVGATTMHALMQATGMVNDHAPGCFRRSSC